MAPAEARRTTLHSPVWLTEEGPESDIVVSSRCRIARNLADYPFPWRASEWQRRETAHRLLEAVDAAPVFDRAARICRDSLTDEDVQPLIEMRVASASWWSEGTARWLVASQNRTSSLLINEEDHARLQAILPGLQVESCLKAAQDVEAELAERVRFAEAPDIGFLTASLTNAGTGIRLSAMLHLPALAANETLPEVLSAASRLGCAVRGAYGEGSSAVGAFYQVSNTRACFVETYRIVDRVRSAASYLVNAEREARRAHFGDEPGRGSLRETTADVLRLLFTEEAAQARLLGLVSLLRLGAAEGILPVSLSECAGWITIAGAAPAPTTDPSAQRFHAIRRTAEIRQRVRRALGATGTFDMGRTDS